MSKADKILRKVKKQIDNYNEVLKEYDPSIVNTKLVKSIFDNSVLKKINKKYDTSLESLIANINDLLVLTVTKKHTSKRYDSYLTDEITNGLKGGVKSKHKVTIDDLINIDKGVFGVDAKTAKELIANVSGLKVETPDVMYRINNCRKKENELCVYYIVNKDYKLLTNEILPIVTLDI